MVNFYVHRIQSGKMTLDEVPKKWRAKVETELNRN